MTTDAVDPAVLRFPNEREFTKRVLEEAEEQGWLHYHVFEQKNPARRSSKGYPDLFVVRSFRMIFAELKSDKKSAKLTPDQKIWLDALIEVARYSLGMKVFVWRPADFEAIVEELERD